MPKIDKMFAYVMADKDEDDEGVPAVMTPNGMWFPLVGADEARILSPRLREDAQQIANKQGKPIKILKFTQFEVLEVIQPKTGN